MDLVRVSYSYDWLYEFGGFYGKPRRFWSNCTKVQLFCLHRVICICSSVCIHVTNDWDWLGTACHARLPKWLISSLQQAWNLSKHGCKKNADPNMNISQLSWRFPKIGGTPKSFIYRFIFYYKPSIVGYPPLYASPQFPKYSGQTCQSGHQVTQKRDT